MAVDSNPLPCGNEARLGPLVMTAYRFIQSSRLETSSKAPGRLRGEEWDPTGQPGPQADEGVRIPLQSEIMTESSGAVPYRDRRGGLIFFGIVQLAIGALALLGFAVTTTGIVLGGYDGHAAMPARAMIPGLVIYALAGVVMISLGTGSILCRRWARALTLAVSWIWLLLGFFGTGSMWAASRMIAHVVPDEMAEMRAVMFGCMSVFVLGFGILLPALFVLFYRSDHVAETCRLRDPHHRWTDDVPIPLLAFSIWIGYTGVVMFSSISYGILPIGGSFVTGFPAGVVFAIAGALFVYVAIEFARRKKAAWWFALTLLTISGIYGGFTFATLDFQQMQSLMGLSPRPGSPDMSGFYRHPAFLGSMAASWIAAMGFLVYVRRYFHRDASS